MPLLSRLSCTNAYPNYHLNGYQWEGARPLFGRPSIGYRSIVYVPLDGKQQVIEWLNVHAEPGEVAQLYAGPPFVINFLAPDSVYQLTDGFEESLDKKPDYVVLHIGSSISIEAGRETHQGNFIRYPLDMDILINEYKQVFSVYIVPLI